MCCLYSRVSVSLDCPNVVPIDALSVFSLGVHLVILLLMGDANDMDVLYVSY